MRRESKRRRSYSPKVLILVLGDSDTEGAVTGGANWPSMVVDALRSAGVQNVELSSRRFTAVPPNADAYAGRRVSELKPDIVVLPVSAWGFTSQFVEYRVQRLLGKRAARWYKRLENRFDRATRERRASPAGANKVARGLLRRIIGTAPQISAGELAEHYREVFRALARFEDTQVIAMMYPGLTLSTLPPKVRNARTAYAAAMRKAAESHRFAWLAADRIFPNGADIRQYALDDLHFNEAGHRLIADEMLKILRPMAGVTA